MRRGLTDERFPYRHLVLLRTERGVPVDYAVECDVPIGAAFAWIPMFDAAVTMSTSFSEDRKIFYFTWRTPFRGILWVAVFAKQEIHILAISPIQQ